MSEQINLSPFQLTATLVVCRLFTLVTAYHRQPEAGSFFTGIAASFVVQLVIALLIMWLANFPGNRTGKVWIAVDKLLLAALWGVCIAVSAVTAGLCVRLVSDCWYSGRLSLVLLAMLGAAAIYSVLMGLQAMVRVAPLIALVSVVGIAALMLGLSTQLHPEYLPKLALSWQGTATTVFYNTIGNLELVLLPMLLRHCKRGLRRSAVVFWLGLSAVVSVVIGGTVMLTLGSYATGRQYPMYELARCSTAAGGGADILLMWLWVLPALLRFGVYLAVGCELWGRLWGRCRRTTRRPIAQGTAAILLSLLLLTGCTEAGIANKTMVTLLELERQGNSCTVRVEYLDLSDGKEEKQYRVCETEQDSVREAVDSLQRDYGRRLYLGGCSLVVLSGEWGSDSMVQWLGELDSLQELRPSTGLLLYSGTLLDPASNEKQSAATALRRLFASKGGTLPDSCSLKDTLARLGDPGLTLELPVAEERDSQATIASWQQIKQTELNVK